MYVRSIADQAKRVSGDTKHAASGYSESMLVRVSVLVKAFGLSEGDVDEQLKDFQQNHYAQIRAACAVVKNP